MIIMPHNYYDNIDKESLLTANQLTPCPGPPDLTFSVIQPPDHEGGLNHTSKYLI